MEPIRADVDGKPTDDTPRRNIEPPVLDAFGCALADGSIAGKKAYRTTQEFLQPPVVRGSPSTQFVADLPAPDIEPVEFAVRHIRAIFSKEAADALFADRPLEKIYSAPRRFDIATTFVVSTAFAILFTILGYCEFSSEAKLAWCTYFFGVGFAQAALYGGRAPRTASVVAGSLLLPCVAFGFVVSLGSIALCMEFSAFIFGIPGGYLAGAIIGGVFLVADKLRNWLGM